MQPIREQSSPRAMLPAVRSSAFGPYLLDFFFSFLERLTAA